MKAFASRTFPTLPGSLKSAVLDLVATEGVAFSIVDNPSFLNLVEICKSLKKVEMPTRQALSSSVLPNDYASARNIIREELKNVTKVSLTTDGWTGPRGVGYIVLTCHHLTSNFELKSLPIGFTTVSGRHTTENLCKSVKEILTEFGIELTKVAGITTDEGGAAPCIAEALSPEIAEIHCACHLAQTALRNAYKRTTALHPHLRDLVACVSNFAIAYNRREGFRKVFQACQLQTGCTRPLVSPSDTRWNYLLHTIQSTIVNKDGIRLWVMQQLQLPEGAREPLCLDMETILSSDWELLAEFTQILQLFETFTKVMQQDTKPTLHNLIPSYVRLTNDLTDRKGSARTDIVRDFISEALNCLMIKFEEQSPDGMFCWDEMELLALALNPLGDVLDPHQSMLWDRGIQLLKARIPCIQVQQDIRIVNPQDGPTVEAQGDIDLRYQRRKRASEDEDEVATYMKLAERNCLPVEQFWPMFKDSLPKLFDLAVSVLSIPASQTTSERVFSLMKHVVSDLRTRMKPETAKMLLFITWQGKRRNADLIMAQRCKRSETNAAADVKRKETAEKTRQERLRQSIGDYANLDRMGALAASMDVVPERETAQTVAEQLQQQIGDGEVADDNEYEQSTDIEIEDDEMSDCEDYEAPLPKVPRTAETTGAEGTRTRCSAVHLKINYVENEDGLVIHFKKPPATSMREILGAKAKYFEPEKEEVVRGELCWVLRLTETGWRRFGFDRERAAKYIGGKAYTIVL